MRTVREWLRVGEPTDKEQATLRVPWLHGRSPRPPAGGLLRRARGGCMAQLGHPGAWDRVGLILWTDRWQGLPVTRSHMCPQAPQRVRAMCNVTGRFWLELSPPQRLVKSCRQTAEEWVVLSPARFLAQSPEPLEFPR